MQLCLNFELKIGVNVNEEYRIVFFSINSIFLILHFHYTRLCLLLIQYTCTVFVMALHVFLSLNTNVHIIL